MPNEYPVYKYSGPFKKAIDIADYYGFRLVKPLSAYEDDPNDSSSLSCVPLSEKKAAIEFYQEQFRGAKEPVMVCHTRYPRRKDGYLKLEVFGSSKSIAEALLLKAAIDILREHGHKDLRVEINSLGNKESRENFSREFTSYYRKNLSNLGECCQTIFRNDAFRVVECSNNTCVELRETAPRPIEFLNEDGRRHLMEIIEFIESMSLPYRINEHLIGPTDSHSRTLFQIVSIKSVKGEEQVHKLLARGDRYDYVTRKLKYRTIIPAVGVAIELGGGKTEKYESAKNVQKNKPMIHYIHLGVEAKRLSLPLLEELRRHGISVWAQLMEDSLSAQIAAAEQSRVPYAIIMGLKEVQERAVIVRDMATRAQETIPIDILPKYLSRIVKR